MAEVDIEDVDVAAEAVTMVDLKVGVAIEIAMIQVRYPPCL